MVCDSLTIFCFSLNKMNKHFPNNANIYILSLVGTEKWLKIHSWFFFQQWVVWMLNSFGFPTVFIYFFKRRICSEWKAICHKTLTNQRAVYCARWNHTKNVNNVQSSFLILWDLFIWNRERPVNYLHPTYKFSVLPLSSSPCEYIFIFNIRPKDHLWLLDRNEYSWLHNIMSTLQREWNH